MSKTPYIHVESNLVTIIGEPASLEALGHALLMKAKLGRNFQCTITDGVNTPIRIISADDFDQEE
jgi:hypothetical protein